MFEQYVKNIVNLKVKKKQLFYVMAVSATKKKKKKVTSKQVREKFNSSICMCQSEFRTFI